MVNEVKEWQSKAELQDHARQSEPWSMLIGKESEAPRKFYSISVQLAINTFLELCVVSSGTGILPSTILVENGKLLAVGYDDYVTLIDTTVRRELFKKKLDGIFYEFLESTANHFTILHELGLIRLDLLGNELWSLATDIIETWQLQSEKFVVIKILDSDKRLIVNLETGSANVKT